MKLIRDNNSRNIIKEIKATLLKFIKIDMLIKH